MLEGRIRKIDLEKRSAVIAVKDGEVLNVQFPPQALIEVMELETAGMEGGELEDLQVGYFVEFEVAEQHEDGSCTCLSLASIS